jgi:hypothetical protein
MVDPIKYEVRPVGGPGSPGVLFVEGQRFNVQRVYAAPVSNIRFKPGDVIKYDSTGSPVLERPIGPQTSSQKLTGAGGLASISLTTGAVAVYSQRAATLEAERAAASSQARLQADVEELDSLNDQLKHFNDLLRVKAKDILGKELGDTPAEWRAALARRKGYQTKPESAAAKPTLTALIPPGYVPNFNGVLAFDQFLSTGTMNH